MARTRSRKRRPAGAKRAPSGDAGAAASHAAPAPTRARAAAPKQTRTSRARAPRRSPAAPTYGERPHAPWHPLPLSELLILVGAIVAALQFSRGGPGLLAGVGAVAIGTFEVTFREHRSGYRSHTMMLALLPVLFLHSAVVLGLAALIAVPRLLNVGLLAVDVALFAVLFKLLRARFLDARHARVLREG